MQLDPSDLYPDRTKAETEADKTISLVPGVRVAVGVFVLLVAILLLSLYFGIAR